jgi:hypothetical protein
MERYISELTRIFKETRDKHEAHRQAQNVLQDICGDHGFIAAVLRRHLSKPETLNAKNYPVVAFDIEFNPYYWLVANCWIPLPGRETHVSTKAIHHHGRLLLTTATVFGPGYEHWLFTKPVMMDPARELFSTQVTERRLHSLHDVALVDAYVPHLPFYPERLTITLALWSSNSPTTWKDRVKRIPLLKKNETVLKRIARRARLAGKLDLNIVEYFDFYPTDQGFRGMKERVEYERGPNEDHLQSLFHILQQTGNENLAPLVERHAEGVGAVANPQAVRRLLRALQSGRPIDGRLSECHFGVPHTTFSGQDIERAAMALRAGIRQTSA